MSACPEATISATRGEGTPSRLANASRHPGDSFQPDERAFYLRHQGYGLRGGQQLIATTIEQGETQGVFHVAHQPGDRRLSHGQ
jgi:hypothetical protein